MSDKCRRMPGERATPRDAEPRSTQGVVLEEMAGRGLWEGDRGFWIKMLRTLLKTTRGSPLWNT